MNFPLYILGKSGKIENYPLTHDLFQLSFLLGTERNFTQIILIFCVVENWFWDKCLISYIANRILIFGYLEYAGFHEASDDMSLK